MLYARINRATKEVLEFPLSDVEVRARFASTTLPDPITSFSLLGTEYVEVPPSFSELKPSITHRVGVATAAYNEETEEYERTYGLVEIRSQAMRERRVRERWVYLKKYRLKALREYDDRVSRYDSQVRLGVTPVDNIADLDAFAQKLRDMTDTYAENPYMIDDETFFDLPE